MAFDQRPYTTGSVYGWSLAETRDGGQPWDIATASAVTLYLYRPYGPAPRALAASLSAGVWQASCAAGDLDQGGLWERTWEVVDAAGPHRSQPIPFLVDGSLPAAAAAPPPAPGFDHSLLSRLDYAASGHTGFAPSARQVLAGAGLSGGGPLSADVTLSLPAVGVPGAYGDASHYPVITTDAQGRVAAVGLAASGGGQPAYSPFTLLLAGGAEQTHVNHGLFWPTAQGYDLGTGFLWEAWVKPLATAGNGYLVSDGYGGSHSLLWGFGAVPGAVTGNLWNGTTSVSFGGTYVVAAGEWVHLAVLWLGTNVYCYVNGVCDGQVTFNGPRVTPAPGGPGVLYVGGSDHLNLACQLAALRGYDRGTPLNTNVTPGWAFHPERRFGIDAQRSNAIGSRQPDFLADYTVPGVTIPDHSPGGCVSGSNYVPAPGTVTATPAAGGALAAGTTYFYKVTCVNGGGRGESTPSAEASALASGSNLKVSLSWAAVAGADSYNVYRSTATGAETFLANTATPSYPDAGAVTPASNLPPVLNATGYPTRHPGYLEDLANLGPGQGAANNQNGPWTLGRWGDPKSSWVSDPSCPYGQAVGASLPAENVPAPAAVPALALAFDSFGRANQTYGFQAAPALGNTEGGSLGPLAWQYGAGAWGILGGAAVYLGNVIASPAWVPVGTANQDVRVTNRRGAYTNGGCGIAFRVQDAANFWYAFAYGDVGPNNIIHYGTVVAGVVTDVGTFNPGTAWNTLRVLASGTTITVYTDATQGVQLTGQAQFQTAQGAGLADSYLASFIHSLHRNRNWTVFQG